MKSFKLDRRKFLKLSTTMVGSSLVIGVNWSCTSCLDRDLMDDAFVPNAWLRITPDEKITVIVAESEMGQGPYTLMPMMVAEELEVGWDQIEVERASVDPVYGYQMTGGSSSIRKGWSTLREAGAIAREVLVHAATRKLNVSYSDCRADKGYIKHLPSGDTVSYGQLLEIAKDIAIPEHVLLKEPHEFKIIGSSVHRKDIPEKINGSATFGLDVRLPDQIYATVVHCPVFGGRAKSIDSKVALQSKAVIDVFEINEGVAVVASDTWTAFKAAKEINVNWDYGKKIHLSSNSILRKIKNSDQSVSEKNIKKGNVDRLFKDLKSTHSSHYLLPYQAHMTMEPMNCTAHFKPDGSLEIWAPTQSPSAAYDTAKRLTQSKLERGIKNISYRAINGYDDSIIVNTTLLGGGFGRRLKQDYVSEVVQIAQRFEQPVQLVWTREEDVQHDFYQPMSVHELKAELDDKGMPTGWGHIIKGAEVSSFGAEHSYDIANQHIQVLDIGNVIPKGPWRSVDAHYNIFAVEHFFDELALKGGHDPVELRLKLLNKSPRLRHVLETVADRINRPGKSNDRYFYGSAVASTFGSHVAQVVELEKILGKGYRVNKVVCAIDCGIVINPDIVKQQMEGSIIFGLSAATQSKVTINNGRVEQSNFHDFPVLRMHEVPEIDVIIIQNEEEPGGIGEPGVPPVAPALANAIFADTGKPIQELPVKLHSFF